MLYARLDTFKMHSSPDAICMISIIRFARVHARFVQFHKRKKGDFHWSYDTGDKKSAFSCRRGVIGDEEMNY